MTAIASLILSAALGTCSPAATCSDVVANFTGHIEESGIKVTWSTDSEDGSAPTVALYIIRRYQSDPMESQYVASVEDAGSCATTEDYSYKEEPKPTGAWTYTLEVWRSDSVRQCAVDAVPE